VVLRYEIAAARKAELGGYEFAVTLAFRSEAGTEIRKSKQYYVKQLSSRRWHVAPTLPDSEDGPGKPTPPVASQPKLQDILDQAVQLQAPALGLGQASNVDAFAERTWDLVNNEFKFKKARDQVHRSTFSTPKEDRDALSVGILSARNSILEGGKYDFTSGTYVLLLDYWFLYFAKSRSVPVSTADRCTLAAVFKLDEKTAERWREAIESRQFSLSVWYRFKSVTKASRSINPHFTSGKLAYDILIDIEVLHHEVALGGR
jgi:hypothetical protein